MSRYAVSGRTTATAATLDNAACALWNPASAKRLWVVSIAWIKTTGTADSHKLIRTSTRGTQSTTVTPDLDNAFERDAAPGTGAVLDVAYSAQPTLQGPELRRWNLPAAIGSGFEWTFPGAGICVPPGTGLAIAVPEIGTEVAIQAADVTFTWDE